MKAKTYYIHPKSLAMQEADAKISGADAWLHLLQHKVVMMHPGANQSHEGPWLPTEEEHVPFKVIKQSDMEKLVKRAARAPRAYWAGDINRPISVGEEAARAVFKSIGLLP